MTNEETKELYDAITLAKKECPDIYAQSYLEAITEAGVLYGQNGVRTQLLHCLNNMQYWRGESARKVKGIFKKVIKELSN